jgi:MscS family membrane protein
MNETYLYLKETVYLDNSLLNLLKFAVILSMGLLFKRLFARLLSRESFRIFKAFSHDQFSDVFMSLLKQPFERLTTLAVIYFSFNHLRFPESWELAHHSEFGVHWIIRVIFGVMVVYSICIVFLRAADFITHVLQNRTENPVSVELSNFIKEFLKVVLVVLFIFAGLRLVFGVNLTPLVASLGIGGLAIALAAQDTLSNLIASFVIFIDKPFKSGDLVDFDGIRGRVEHVGFRTTRVRTLDRSLITVPNKRLIDTAMNNVTLSPARRVTFSIGVTYQTKSHQIKAIIEDIKKVINEHPNTAEEVTVRFSDFNSSSLDILVIYFVNSNDFNIMIETKEDINFQIMQIVRKHEASFAFPSQSVYVEQFPKQ